MGARDGRNPTGSLPELAAFAERSVAEVMSQSPDIGDVMLRARLELHLREAAPDVQAAESAMEDAGGVADVAKRHARLEGLLRSRMAGWYTCLQRNWPGLRAGASMAWAPFSL